MSIPARSLARRLPACSSVLLLALLGSPVAAATPDPVDGPPASAVPAPDPDFMFGTPKGSILLRGGLGFTRAAGDLFGEVTDLLTLGREDFITGAGGLDLDIKVQDQWNVVVGVGLAYAASGSEFRDWVDLDDQAIEQETRLTQVPITLSVKRYLRPTGRRISDLAWIPARLAPYVGAGAGAMWYKFEQAGDFVDFETLDIFTSKLATDGFTPMGQVFGGVDIGLSRAAALVAEARLVVASANPGGDSASSDPFATYDSLDLSGLQTSIGLRIRF